MVKDNIIGDAAANNSDRKSILQKKSALRQKMKMLLQHASKGCLKEASVSIQTRAQQWMQWFAAVAGGATGPVLSYAHMPFEVDTTILNAGLVSEKKLHLPRVTDKSLEIIPVSLETDLVSGYQNIMEPADNVIALSNVESIKIIFLPGLAFNEDCMRLGRGKGFYDRLLTSLDPRPACVGLAYACQINASLPVTLLDSRLDFVLTESNIYQTALRFPQLIDLPTQKEH